MGNVEMEGNWRISVNTVNTENSEHREHSEYRHIIHDTRHPGFIELLLSEGKPWWW